jgi:RiboL-PSP-HEPN
VSPADLDLELEQELAWRVDELRQLGNTLLGSASADQWSETAKRTLIVMLYAHLEGYCRHVLGVYVRALNNAAPNSSDARPELAAAALARSFRTLRVGDDASHLKGSEPFHRRAKRETTFVEEVRSRESGPLVLEEEAVVSLEMNLGADVLKRALYRLGIPTEKVENADYMALEFIRRKRNDVAHGAGGVQIHTSEFRAHREKGERLMRQLKSLVFRAYVERWYLSGGAA